MSEHPADRQAVLDVLVQPISDAQAADLILSRLREKGWASPAEVALIVNAAGGRVRVPWAARVEADLGTASKLELQTYEDIHPHGGARDLILKVRRVPRT